MGDRTYEALREVEFFGRCVLCKCTSGMISVAPPGLRPILPDC
jgi:hypothetical protein